MAEIIICGAGIAGVSAAYFLSQAGVRDILLLDERSPLSFTSDRSTECYRNWWPDASMAAMMNRSIDIMERLALSNGNAFHLNRRGYLYVTGDPKKIPTLEANAERTAELTYGTLRVHFSGASDYKPAPALGFQDQPDGADLLIGHDLLQQHFPYLSADASAALHVRRAGWLSAQQLGMFLLEGARAAGVQFVNEPITGLELQGGRVAGVQLAGGRSIPCNIFINAAGPFLNNVAGFMGMRLPVHTELHLKAAIQDSLGVVARDAPLLIWTDPQRLPWKTGERTELAQDPETRWLTETFPASVHTRPEGTGTSQNILMLWEYQNMDCAPELPPALDDIYPEVALRGLSTMLPGMRAYFDRIPRSQLDGGCYTKTPENRPLVGPTKVQGSYVLGAVSGYGIMSACALGELLAAHITGAHLPDYAPAFLPSRFEDPQYLDQFSGEPDLGQL
jgi:sarcosine oxidase, subunit beta